jgi:hypothetical protein
MKIKLTGKEYENFQDIMLGIDLAFENINTYIDDEHTDDPEHHFRSLEDIYSQFKHRLNEWKESNVYVKGVVKYKHDEATELMIETISEFDASLFSDDYTDITCDIYEVVREIDEDPFKTTNEKLHYVKADVIVDLYEKVIATGFKYTPVI